MELLQTYKYFIIIPLATIEGPIISVICGFLTTLGVFNLYLVFVVMLLGDILGDAIQYSIGYFGKRFLPYLKISDEKLESAKIYLKNNHKKAIVASKLLYGIGFVGLIAAGALHVPYFKYFKTCALISVIQSLVMITIGIFFGQAYVIIEKYFNYYAALSSVVVLVILFFIFIRKYRKEVSKKINL